MKKSLFGKTFKPSFLAIPAAALMLGAAQAQTTIGINFVAQYATYAAVGTGYAGYQMSGFPVTAMAFGIAPANWVNTGLLLGFHYNTTATYNSSFAAGSVAVNLSYANMWSTDLGDLDPYPYYSSEYWATPGSVNPGNDEVTWAIEDNTGWTNTLSGLATTFPHGYVLQLISAAGNTGAKLTSSSSVKITDGATFTNSPTFNIYAAGNTNAPGTVGLAATPVLTSDAISMSSVNCSLAGFILTDKPVVSLPPAGTTNYIGVPLVLKTGAIGIPPLSYQWQLNGSPIPGATAANYTNNNPILTDAGNYTVVVTNLYGSTTSATASVTLSQSSPIIVTDLSAVTNTFYAGFYRLLSVSAGGSFPLNYQWKVNGTSISGATNTSLIASNLTAGFFGYSVAVMNSLGTTNSQTNYINVMATPAGLVNTYTPQVGADAPLAYWPLNETSGAIAYDYAGSGNNATIIGSMTLGAAGPQPPAFIGFNAGNTAYQFDGTSAYIACGTNVSIAGTSDFTVEAWIKTAANAVSMIASQRETNGYNGEYQFEVTASGTLSISIYGNNTYQFNGLSSAKTVNDGSWHHVAFVRSGNTGTIYADGVTVATTNATVQPLNATFPTYIGIDHRDNADFFNGEMASVAIYNQALSANRVLAHAVAGGIIPSVAIVNGSIGGLVVDSKPVGTLHNGVSHGTIWLASSSDLGSTTRTGVNEFAWTNNSQIVIPANADFNTPNGTISFWMFYNKPTSYPGPGSGYPMLVDRRAGTGNGGDGMVVSLNSGGVINIQPHGAATLNGSSFVVDGGWHHITITYGQTTNDSVTLYVDGNVDTTLANSVNWTWNPTQEIELGKSHDAYYNLYDGQMDDFRIYNKILSPSEVQAIYTGDDSSVTDPNNLEVRFNFDAADAPIVGKLLVFPYGTLQSSPVLGTGAVWTTVTNAVSPQILIPNPSVPAIFYRSTIAP